MPPLSLDVNPNPRALTLGEREKILVGVCQGLSVRAIARGIGRDPSTVSRELARNMRHRYVRGRAGRPRIRGWDYSPSRAQRRADANLARPKPAKLAGNRRLGDEVVARLEARHSPEQIAARLRVDYPDDPQMWVSHETIYRSLYVQGRGALRRDLHRCLRTGRALRRPRGRASQRPGAIPNMVHISARPPEVADRAVPGHWEGDLITGAGNASAIGTLVERSTGFTLLLHLPGRHGALELAQAMAATMAQLPATLNKTLTWDQGQEMANHAQITQATGLAIYFCDPHAPWQRATSENTNGLLRQYFPKGTDLSIHPPDHLNHVAAQLNTRPRKRLGWKTPAEALDQLLSQPPNP